MRQERSTTNPNIRPYVDYFFDHREDLVEFLGSNEGCLNKRGKTLAAFLKESKTEHTARKFEDFIYEKHGGRNEKSLSFEDFWCVVAGEEDRNAKHRTFQTIGYRRFCLNLNKLVDVNASKYSSGNNNLIDPIDKQNAINRFAMILRRYNARCDDLDNELLVFGQLDLLFVCSLMFSNENEMLLNMRCSPFSFSNKRRTLYMTSTRGRALWMWARFVLNVLKDLANGGEVTPKYLSDRFELECSSFGGFVSNYTRKAIKAHFEHAKTNLEALGFERFDVGGASSESVYSDRIGGITCVYSGYYLSRFDQNSSRVSDADVAAEIMADFLVLFMVLAFDIRWNDLELDSDLAKVWIPFFRWKDVECIKEHVDAADLGSVISVLDKQNIPNLLNNVYKECSVGTSVKGEKPSRDGLIDSVKKVAQELRYDLSRFDNSCACDCERFQFVTHFLSYFIMWSQEGDLSSPSGYEQAYERAERAARLARALYARYLHATPVFSAQDGSETASRDKDLVVLMCSMAVVTMSYELASQPDCFDSIQWPVIDEGCGEIECREVGRALSELFLGENGLRMLVPYMSGSSNRRFRLSASSLMRCLGALWRLDPVLLKDGDGRFLDEFYCVFVSDPDRPDELTTNVMVSRPKHWEAQPLLAPWDIKQERVRLGHILYPLDRQTDDRIGVLTQEQFGRVQEEYNFMEIFEWLGGLPVLETDDYQIVPVPRLSPLEFEKVSLPSGVSERLSPGASQEDRRGS